MERPRPTEEDIQEEIIRKAKVVYCDPIGESQEDWENARRVLLENGVDLDQIMIHHHI